VADLDRGGFVVKAHVLRQPDLASGYPSRRCYLFAEREVSG